MDEFDPLRIDMNIQLEKPFSSYKPGEHIIPKGCEEYLDKWHKAMQKVTTKNKKLNEHK